MPSQIYRSTRVVVQNSTRALWTLDAAETLCGEWANRSSPYQDMPEIAPQSSAALVNTSSELLVGAEGFVRFSSVHGQCHIHWSRPWVGPFEIRADASDPALAVGIEINEDNPAFPVALVVVRPKQERE